METAETATSGNLVNSLVLFTKQVFPFSKQSWFGEASEFLFVNTWPNSSSTKHGGF